MEDRRIGTPGVFKRAMFKAHTLTAQQYFFSGDLIPASHAATVKGGRLPVVVAGSCSIPTKASCPVISAIASCTVASKRSLQVSPPSGNAGAGGGAAAAACGGGAPPPPFALLRFGAIAWGRRAAGRPGALGSLLVGEERRIATDPTGTALFM